MGYNNYGQLGNGTTANSSLPVNVASNVVAVAAGTYHSLFVKSDGTLWAMGWNGYGQLGNGTTNSTSIPIQISGLTIASLGAGSIASHSLVVATLLPPTLTTGNAVWTNDGLQLTVQLTGSPNYPYILQMATHLTPPVNWQPIFTNPADGNGNWNFTVTNLLDLPAGFYRAVAQ
jgi:hypothetical protein